MKTFMEQQRMRAIDNFRNQFTHLMREFQVPQSSQTTHSRQRHNIQLSWFLDFCG